MLFIWLCLYFADNIALGKYWNVFKKVQLLCLILHGLFISAVRPTYAYFIMFTRALYGLLVSIVGK